MKLFTKNTFRNLALSALSAAVLSACGGAGSCATCTTTTPGSLTLSIAAPSQYPAGLATPIEASLTMTNTSSVDANNLVYNIPLPNQTGNYTGVVITPNAGIGSPSGACTNIPAGASCTFSATIAAYANPGSFTVTATPNGSTSSATKATQSGKSLQAGDSISVTANLGLVDVPNTNNEYYILPSEQTVQGSTGSPSTAYVSVWVKKAGEGLNSLKLVDDVDVELAYEPVGTPSYAVNSVNSYKVTIPAGKTIQHIQALSNVCTTLNNGENNNTACSNDADVNLAQSGVGILAIQPNYFQMSEIRESQVVTLQNVGTANITAMQMPVIAAPFSVLANTCTGITSLKPADSCSVTIGYTAGSTSGQGSYVINYNNGTSAVNTTATIPYVGTGPIPYAILTTTPTSFSLSENHPFQRITVTNTGTASATGIALPALTAPLTESVGFTTCTAGSSLPIGSSCSYAVYIDYTQEQSAGRESVTFSYYNGRSAQTTNVAADWSAFTPPPPGLFIFVTSQRSTGDLKSAGHGVDGFDGANKLCQAAANSGSMTSGLGATWKALLVGDDTSTTPPTFTTNGATIVGQSYYNLNESFLAVATNGALVAELYWNSFDTPALENMINIDENGNIPSDDYYGIWTGTISYNWYYVTYPDFTCSNWSTTEGDGSVGEIGPNRGTYSWFSYNNFYCNTENRLYCVQQSYK